jgi:Uma2 family endonuclease
VPNYTPTLELTLDISTANLSQFDIRAKEELKPDIGLYPATRRGLSRPNDILKMLEMPLAAIEILSPKQGIYDLKEKFKAYFALGVKSCWLVTPELEVISVYTTISDFKNYDKRSGSLEVVDETLEIRLPLDQIFN